MCFRARAVYHYMLEFINRDGSGPFYRVQSAIYMVHSAAGGNLLLSLLRHLWFCNLGVCNMKYRCRGERARGRFLPHTRRLKSLSCRTYGDPVGMHALKRKRETEREGKEKEKKKENPA